MNIMTAYSPLFSKLAPHPKIQFENSTRFTWRIIGKSDEINFAHFTISV